MMLLNNELKREQHVDLKDGRKLYKTNNGFTYWCENKKGVAEEVTLEYYMKALKNRVHAKSTIERRSPIKR